MTRLSDRLTALLKNPETPTYVLRDAVAEEEEPVASVWVVEGQSGEYSDKTHWLVAAYLEREAAEACIARLNEWVVGNGWGRDEPEEWWFEDDDKKPRPPDDPLFRHVYGGVRYVLGEIPLKVGEGQ